MKNNFHSIVHVYYIHIRKSMLATNFSHIVESLALYDV